MSELPKMGVIRCAQTSQKESGWRFQLSG